jgi:hypothetical protein
LKKIIVSYLCLLLFSCTGAKISAEHDISAGPVSLPKMVYVMDFELNATDIHSDAGLLNSQREHSGPLRAALSELRHQKDPAVRSKELVDLMSKSLLEELSKRNLNASRLGAAEAMPVEGLLVRGVFVHVEEGNRLRRAAIGFGSGESGLQIVVSVDDLAQGSPKPLYELDTRAESGKMPGAVITLNPYVAAAKFVLSGRDLDRNIAKIASKIADNIAERIRKQASSSNQNPH